MVFHPEHRASVHHDSGRTSLKVPLFFKANTILAGIWVGCIKGLERNPLYVLKNQFPCTIPCTQSTVTTSKMRFLQTLRHTHIIVPQTLRHAQIIVLQTLRHTQIIVLESLVALVLMPHGKE